MAGVKPFHFTIAIIVVLVGTGLVYFHLNSEENGPQGASAGGQNMIDSTGTEISIPKNLTRIGIVNTFTAEVLMALDVDMTIVVGVSGDFSGEERSELWGELKGKRVIQVSAHGEPDIEAMLDLRIQMLITFATHQFVDISSIRSKLSPAHIVVVGVDLYKYDSLYDEIELLGDIFQKEEEASDLIENLKGIEENIDTRISGLNDDEIKTVVIEHHSSSARDPTVRSSQSDWNIVLERCGGENLFRDEPGSVAHVDPEFIIESNPDIFLFDGNLVDLGYGSDDMTEASALLKSVKERDGYSTMKAVSNGDLFILSGEFSGPMIIHGMMVIAKILHPDLFEDIDPEEMVSDYYQLVYGVDARGTFYYPAI